MSKQYDDYIQEHRENVYKAFQWLKENVPEVFPDEFVKARCEVNCQFYHDDSKNTLEEYDAYDAYFYGGNRSYKVVNEFRLAWLHHIHKNKHHWQHWVLVNDDPEEGTIAIDMDDDSIIEMICDWWSFSWKQGKLDEIFSWYDEHKAHMILSERTRNKVENILIDIRNKLSDLNEK